MKFDIATQFVLPQKIQIALQNTNFQEHTIFIAAAMMTNCNNSR